jgi:hypothetical protein
MVSTHEHRHGQAYISCELRLGAQEHEPLRRVCDCIFTCPHSIAIAPSRDSPGRHHLERGSASRCTFRILPTDCAVSSGGISHVCRVHWIGELCYW